MVFFRYEDIDFQLYEDDYEGLLDEEDEEDEGRDAQEKVDDELVKIGRIHIKEPPFDMNQFDADIQTRFEYMKKYLVCDETNKVESENFLLELTRNMLVIWQHDFGTIEEASTMMNSFFGEKQLFSSKHDSARRSSSVGTSKSCGYRTLDVINQDQAFKSFIETTNKIFHGMIYKAFVFHFFGEEGGHFKFHRDKFRADFRIIATIGGNKVGKRMRFVNRETKARLELSVPHGTCIALSRVASGADKEKGSMYFHEVVNTAGTTSFTFQLNMYKSTIQIWNRG
jgi:hypothetical protein